MRFLTAAEKRHQAENAGRPRWSAIWLIYFREMRDQLRDRRTLFTIAVLPVLLYPLVGTLLLQMAQFTREHKTSVCVVGNEYLTNAPTLIADEAFDESLVPETGSNLELMQYSWDSLSERGDTNELAQRWVREGAFDVVLMVPKDFQSTRHTAATLPEIQLMFNVASDQSMVAKERVTSILGKWREGWIRERLSKTGIQVDSLNPFTLADTDIAPANTREAAFWSKLLPFIMLVWAMTGAFYPAIDLVAGEKERGTLETLLCSPALRSEIVWGKLGAVATFSMLTALMNAGSMLVTSSFVFGHLGAGSAGMVGSPPLAPMLWLLVALIPLSLLFSSMALAIAAMARSSKEGQYYLMPLMMVTLPLVLLPMLPGTTLNIGTSLIPVTGMFLMVRALVEGQFGAALFHLPIVFTVTSTCLWLSTRWVRRQFESESVLFGDGDQWEIGSWVRHLWRDRQLAATPAQGLACGVTILVVLFFGRLAMAGASMQTATDIAKMVLMPQIAMILFPALLMATMFTKSLRTSLRLRIPHWTTIPLAILVGVTLHPLYFELGKFINYMYPISEQTVAAMRPFAEQISDMPWLNVVLLLALVPAICEELAFRGFVFGGLVRKSGGLRAVIITALMFGISHGVLQQSIAASVMGVLLGWVALKTGSVIPGMLIHFTNNALSVSMERIPASGWEAAPLFFQQTEAGTVYQPFWVVVSGGIAVTCLLYFGTLRSEHDANLDQVDMDLLDLRDPGTQLTASPA